MRDWPSWKNAWTALSASAERVLGSSRGANGASRRWVAGVGGAKVFMLGCSLALWFMEYKYLIIKI